MKAPEGGVTYIVNRNHPLVARLKLEFPEAKGALETLLKNIERGIPLNQLYVDLNNDEKLDNDAELDEGEVRNTLEQLIASMPSGLVRREFLETIQHTEALLESILYLYGKLRSTCLTTSLIVAHKLNNPLGAHSIST